MNDSKPYGLATRTIHDHGTSDAYGSPFPPIYDTTTFAFNTTAELLDVVEGRTAGGLYTREGLNPTITAVERTLASLEQADTACAFASGMAALSTLFLAHGRTGVICVGNVYGGTLEILGRQLPSLGIRTALLIDDDPERLDALLADGYGLVIFETPTNPTVQILDIADLARRCHAHGALVAVDNTFASPVNQRPLEHGADLVVHSATKYLGGHSDLTAGAVMGAAEHLEPVQAWRKTLGSILAPATAALLSRSLRTLVLRIQQHNASAHAIAETMAAHPAVARVHYPGLPGTSDHEVARKQMDGFGGMLGLDIQGGGDAATRVADHLELFALAPSLGGTESLITQPATTSHHALSLQQREQRGINDNLLRLSVGLETTDDLIADLERALA